MIKISQTAILDPKNNRLDDIISDARHVPLLSVSVSLIVNLLRPPVGLIVHKQLVDKVVLVAKVISKSCNEKTHSLLVSDGTCSANLKVICYGRSIDSEAFRVSGYYKFFGKIKFEHEEIKMAAYVIHPITDFNEISLHCCEIVSQSLHLREIKTKATKVTMIDSTIDRQISDLTINESQPLNQPSEPQPSTSEMNETNVQGETSKFPSIPNVSQVILGLINENKKQEGISKQEISDTLSIPMEQVNDIISKLAAEAHIYAAIDDDHYRSVYEDIPD